MLRGLFILVLSFIIVVGKAQTGNSANPYGSHPYDSNPYVDKNQKDQNFLKKLDDEQEADDKKKKRNTDQQNDNSDNSDSKNNKDASSETNESPNLFSDDPDYINYLKSQGVYTSDKNVNNLPGLSTSDDKDIRTRFYNREGEREMSDNTKDLDTTARAKLKIKSRIYGANFFNNNVFDLSDKTITSAPTDYRLGPGDELIISIWGDSEFQSAYTLGADGSIFPFKIGKISLMGMTFDEASHLIISKFRKIIPANTHLDVQMGKPRLIRVTIEGEVEKPGTYSISSFNTALNAIFRAGGLTELGNLRKIQVRRQGRTVEIIDLYQYLQKATGAEEVYLEDNDYIFVDVYDKLVQAQGKFKRPMYYQLKDDEGLYDLVTLAGGPSYNARRSQLQIKTVFKEEERYINIPGENILDSKSKDDYILKDGDIVTLKPVNSGLRNTVKVEGSVNYPDEYEVRVGDHLTDVIKRAGGLQSDVYLAKAFIFRNENQQESKAIKIDLRNLEVGGENDILMEKGDKIKILSFSNFDEKYKIAVRGFVRKPGDYTYHNDMVLKDMLLLAGGLTLDAENGRIEISNVVDSMDRYNLISNNKGTTIRIVSINSNLEIDEASEKIVIKPMDRIYVRRKVEFLPLDKVMVYGEVNYPGEYVLSQKNEKISSVITHVGGLNENAYANGAKLIRSGVGTVVIDLPKAIAHPNSKYDIAMNDSDVLIVPTMNDIVSIKGNVQSQVNVKFDKDNESIKYYIASAGGFGEDPWKNRISVKYQNGRIKSTKTIFGIRKYPVIKEGCTITVPKKPAKVNKSNFGQVLSYTLSTLTTMITLIVLAKTIK